MFNQDVVSMPVPGRVFLQLSDSTTGFTNTHFAVPMSQSRRED